MGALEERVAYLELALEAERARYSRLRGAVNVIRRIRDREGLDTSGLTPTAMTGFFDLADSIHASKAITELDATEEEATHG